METLFLDICKIALQGEAYAENYFFNIHNEMCDKWYA